MAASEGPTSIPGLVQRLRSGSWIRQAAAVSSLLQLASTGRDARREIVAAGAVPALVGCLQSSSEAVCVPAAQALAQLARGISAAEAQPAIQPLLACLGSKDEGLRSAATRALCALALASCRTCEAIAAAAVEQLGREGCSEEAEVAALGALRQLAAAGLSNREILSGQHLADSTGVLKLLVRCMHEDRPAAVQAEAVAALTAIAEHNYGCIFQIHQTDAIQWLVRLHLRPGTSPPLQRSAEAALHQLAQSGCSKAVDALKAVNYQRQLQDSDQEVLKLVGHWLKAALALGRITASFDAAMEASAQRLERELEELVTPGGRARSSRVATAAAAASAAIAASSAGTAGSAGSAEASTAAPPTPRGRPEPPSLTAAAAAQLHPSAAQEEQPPQQQPQQQRSGRRRRWQQRQQQAPGMTAEEMAAAEAAAQAAAAELLAEEEEQAQRQAAAKAAERQRKKERQREAVAAPGEEQGRGSGGEGDAEAAGASADEPEAAEAVGAAAAAAAAEDAPAAGEDAQLREWSQEQEEEEEQQQQPGQQREQQPAAGSLERSPSAAVTSVSQPASTVAEVHAPHTPAAAPVTPGSSGQSSATRGANSGGSSSRGGGRRRQRGRRRRRDSAEGSELAAGAAGAAVPAGSNDIAGAAGAAGAAANAAAPVQQAAPDAAAELELLLEQLGVGSSLSSSAPTIEPISPPGRASNEPAAAAAVAPAPGAHHAPVAMGSEAAAAEAAGAAPAGPGGPVADPVPPFGPDADLAEELLCSITQEPMEDPVVAADSFTYERSAIEAWIARQAAAGQAPRSPMTGLPLEELSLRPNRALRAVTASMRAAGLLV